MQVADREGAGQQFVDAGANLRRCVAEAMYGRGRTKFGQNPAAGAARRGRRDGGSIDHNGADISTASRDHLSHGVAFGANGQAEGNILDVGA